MGLSTHKNYRLYGFLYNIKSIENMNISLITLGKDGKYNKWETWVVFSIISSLNYFSYSRQTEALVMLFEGICNICNEKDGAMIHPELLMGMFSVLLDNLGYNEKARAYEIHRVWDILVSYTEALEARRITEFPNIKNSYIINQNVVNSYLEAILRKGDVQRAVYLAIFELPETIKYIPDDKTFGIIMSFTFKNSTGVQNKRFFKYFYELYIHYVSPGSRGASLLYSKSPQISRIISDIESEYNFNI
ncbi:hypothetical protein BB559_003245 [Furculomyces boomerangus]|uniref:Uncharacterized protein n=3 Tax=Harpellales TaxID=61421 RepID=A0A2T9YME2_9FUNG|nr:hypothetical protein BB559_003245 [Furculomyces boomerangus]PVZ99775.1 hypothetical protein BB558_004168 [Smittium angustum]